MRNRFCFSRKAEVRATSRSPATSRGSAPSAPPARLIHPPVGGRCRPHYFELGSRRRGAVELADASAAFGGDRVYLKRHGVRRRSVHAVDVIEAEMFLGLRRHE